MAKVKLVRDVLFTHQDGRTELFRAGTHEDLPGHVAEHWFIRANTDCPPAYDPPPGTPEYGQKQLEKRRRAELLAAANEQELDQAREEAKARQRPQLRADVKEEVESGEEQSPAVASGQGLPENEKRTQADEPEEGEKSEQFFREEVQRGHVSESEESQREKDKGAGEREKEKGTGEREKSSNRK